MQFRIRTLMCFSLMLIILALAVSSSAQVNKEYILRNTNVEELQRLSEKWSIDYKVEHAKALRIAREQGWPVQGLQYIDENGLPVYYTTHNNSAATMTQTVLLRNTRGVQGQSMLLGVWEGGHPRATHQDLTGRVQIIDDPYMHTNHATHVAGTLIGNGSGDADAKGMAPLAFINAYNWDDDIAEMTTAASYGLLISNHSYGTIGGWNFDDSNICNDKWTWYGGTTQFVAGGDDPKFGQYNWEARDWDEICWNAPYYLPVKAAGNDNNDTPTEGFLCDDEVRNGTTGAYVNYDISLHPSSDRNQESNITTYGNAKNILTVGNLTEDYIINESSSRGRTDDGRIKPDICGKGTDIYSTQSSSDDDYGELTGTSMASPNVAGSLLLLQELYENMHGNTGIYMRSATLKGLAIHHAQDLGLPGPDFVYGWGLLRTQYMGTSVVRDVGFEGTQEDRILEIPGTLGHVYTFNTTGNFRVTLSYTDRKGTATTIHNDPTPKLVNDLDLTVIGPGGTVYFPYVMSTTFPYLATTGDNDLDNVEQVYRINRPAGTYQVHVNAEGSITGSQPYSLIITGQDNSCNHSISHGPITLTSTTYNAQNDIRSIGDVAAGGTVTYNAGSSVSLKPGFSAPSGSSFIARIQSCN